METEIIESETFTIVFPIKIVTNNLLGKLIRLSRYRYIRLDFLKFESSFFWSSEKRATSEPEKKAELRSRTKIKLSLIDQSKSKNYIILK